ncbi:MAG: beta-ketoacyl synthase N-terminal-like domain-containing protein, partial [Lysobacterales bacterium]
MTEAYIYDHVRSPRGRGKSAGSLHPVTPIELTSQVLAALRERSALDTALIDDVVLGCVTPIGEQGADIARIAVLNADYAECVPGKQLNRFCASGLDAVNTAAAQIMSGQSEVAIGGGVECMSRVPMMADGGAWATDPQVAYKTYFTPQGVSADLIASKFGFSRQDLDAYALASQRRAANAWRQGWFGASVVAIRDHLGRVLLDR